MTEQERYLHNLLKKLAAETRPYCRPSLVNYDIFPVFKEVDQYLKENKDD